MKDTSPAFWTDSYPIVTWTWHDGRGGLLSTQISAEGKVRQLRQHDPSDILTAQYLGSISALQAAAILAQCRDALVSGKSASEAEPYRVTPGDETYQLVITDGASEEYARQVSREEVRTDPVLRTIRREVLRARRRVRNRWVAWTSNGARRLYLTVLAACLLGLFMVSDNRHDVQLQAHARPHRGVVTQHAGVPFKSEFLTVKLDGGKNASEVRVYDFLCHESWSATAVGSRIEVAYDAATERAWLPTDLERWRHRKQTLCLMAGSLLTLIAAGLVWARRFQIGAYDDGGEYLICGDRVVTDDSDSGWSRSTLLWLKRLV